MIEREVLVALREWVVACDKLNEPWDPSESHEETEARLHAASKVAARLQELARRLPPETVT